MFNNFPPVFTHIFKKEYIIKWELFVSSERESSAVHLSTTCIGIQLELYIGLTSVEGLESGVNALFPLPLPLKKLFYLPFKGHY